MTTPSQPGSPTEDPHLPSQHPQEAAAASTAPTKPPGSVLVAVCIAGALAAWQALTVCVGFGDRRQVIRDPSKYPGLTAAHAQLLVDGALAILVILSLVLAVPLVWGAVRAYGGFGRVLSFAAWLYIVIAVSSLFQNTAGAHHFPIEDALTILAALAIVVCQRQAASKTYYAAHRR